MKGSVAFRTAHAARMKKAAREKNIGQWMGKGGSAERKHRKLKVALVIPKFGLVGGAESFAYEAARRIAESETYEITVYAHEWRCKETFLHFRRIPSLPFPRTLRPLFFAWSVGKQLKSDRPDVVHTHERILRSDLFTFHGIPHKTWVRRVRKKPPSPFDLATAWVEEKGMAGSKILPVSNLVKTELLKVYDLPEDRVKVIHPGVSMDRFDGRRREEWRREIRGRHGLEPKALVLLFVGMNFEVKGLGKVIKALAQIAGEKKDVRLLVVGSGPAERYRKMAAGLGLKDRVVFAGISDEVERYYSAGDIFTMPSLFDTFGLVVLEAMASGLPVIISENVGARDLVRDGENGFVLKSNGSVQDLAQRIRRLENREIRGRAGRKAREAASFFSWDRTAAQTADLYRRCAAKKARLRRYPVEHNPT